MQEGVTVRELTPEDRPWAEALMTRLVGMPKAAALGRLIDTRPLPGLMAEIEGDRIGLLHYQFHDPDEAEVVAIAVTKKRKGAGRMLLQRVEEVARIKKCRRVWLVTTNDNLPAQAFYDGCGWDQAKVHAGSVAALRILKPIIPQTGYNGIPITDEIEYERFI